MAATFVKADEWDGDWTAVVDSPSTTHPVLRLAESFGSAAIDEYTTVVVVLRSLLVSFEAFFVASLAAASPCFFYWYHLAGGQPMHFRQSWSIIAVLLVFPLTLTLTSAFTRREAALVQLSLLKSNLTGIFVAHRDWDWWTIPKNACDPSISGREQRLPRQHVQKVLAEMKSISQIMRSLLLAPICSRVRHFYTEAGRQERQRIMSLSRTLNERLTWRLHALSLLVEELKSAGMPANEATRIRQHFVNAMSAIHQLKAVKHYRTPLGLRAFSRLFILVMPVMQGPYYAELALSTHIAFAIALSVTTSLALQGLFHLRFELEDPFIPVAKCGDAVDVEREFKEFDSDLDIFDSSSSSGLPLQWGVNGRISVELPTPM